MKNISVISPIKRFFNLLKVDRQEVISIYVYALFNGIITLTLPLGIQAIINLIRVGQVSTSWVVLVVIVIAGVAFTGVLQIMQLSVSENLQQKIFSRSAFEFAYRIPRLKLEAVDKSYIPELVNRFFDTLSVQKGLSKILIDFSRASLQVIFGLILLSLYHPFFILFSVLLVVIVYLIFRFTAPRGLKTSLMTSSYKYEVAHWLEELARAMETIKLAGKTPLPLERTDQLVSGYLTSRKSHFKTLVIQYINLVGFKVVIAAGLLVIGGLLVINQKMNIGQFVASEIIIILVLTSVEKLILSMETVYDVLTAIEKLGNITDIPLERDNGTKMFSNKKGISVQLRRLSFKFKGRRERLLSDLDVSIKTGEKVCLSGENGSGKSLFLQIVAGFYEGFSGSLSFDKIPLGNLNMEELRSITGDSLSGEDIFKGSLQENITLGKPDISFEELQKVTSLVGLTEFIENLKEGYNTLLLPEGKSLPKSVRLKIKLARCLIGNPKLILLEDNFNQLNNEVKERFLNYLLAQECTVIAISNDPMVAKKFQRLLVLEKGKFIADDNFSNSIDKGWFSKVFQTKEIYA
ncbi:peptidase domain-containing ABC transporter [Xanthovirga aplysinae]|uniref:peptidase domain-containing ABC transporter n=1 Tax=Xanthovirga aplysinae TaxID=2529853 RepID=UPI0012BB70AB|nr:ATP-binding cassette domain-containing protein [Xanthovirga aplysinae]MTI32973.1 ATP-binding cassette domain-containing protein [Xanthovirga aplysinae]